MPKSLIVRYTLLATFFILPGILFAAGPPKPSSIKDPVVLTMVIIMVILLLAIALLANILIGAAQFKVDKEKKSAAATLLTLITIFFLPMTGLAQDENAIAATIKTYPGGMSATAFYFLVGVICLELLVIFILLFHIKQVLAFGKTANLANLPVAPKTVRFKRSFSAWWKKINRFKPLEQEAAIELDHEYDGIRELDNRLPPWWLYGFYLTIIIGAVYMWRYHVAMTAPLSDEELRIELAIAEQQKADYLKNAANNVDENTVQLLSAASDLAAGKKIYITNCAACHGVAGEGTVGPNLSDDYWMHGGSLSDIFKSIKYGWPDKGMKSWKDDFSPIQIAQLTSFIRLLEGTNPPNAKEPQGEIYKEVPAAEGVTASTILP